jgi:hypothetical protein
MALHPGDSAVQRDAEKLMFSWMSAQLSVVLTPGTFAVPGSGSLAVDGVSDDPLILVEAWAHQGPPKPAQTNKVTSDAFKLSFLKRRLDRAARLILLFSDEDAARPFQKGSRRSLAILDAGIEIWVADLPVEIKAAIRDAQTRQYR